MTDAIVLLGCVALLFLSYKFMTKPRWRKYQLYKIGKPLDLEMSAVHMLSIDGPRGRIPMLLNEITCRYETTALTAQRVVEATFIERDPNLFVLDGVIE